MWNLEMQWSKSIATGWRQLSQHLGGWRGGMAHVPGRPRHGPHPSPPIWTAKERVWAHSEPVWDSQVASTVWQGVQYLPGSVTRGGIILAFEWAPWKDRPGLTKSFSRQPNAKIRRARPHPHPRGGLGGEVFEGGRAWLPDGPSVGTTSGYALRNSQDHWPQSNCWCCWWRWCWGEWLLGDINVVNGPLGLGYDVWGNDNVTLFGGITKIKVVSDDDS